MAEIVQPQRICGERSCLRYCTGGQLYMLYSNFTLRCGWNPRQVEIQLSPVIDLHYVCVVGMHVTAEGLINIFDYPMNSFVVTPFQNTNSRIPDFI